MRTRRLPQLLLAGAMFPVVGLAALGTAVALTDPLPGAVPFPSNVELFLPFPAGYDVYVLSGYSPTGGSSLHADTDATAKANDYYALDLTYADEPDSGKGLPIVAPIPGTVVRAGWATSGWANYGLRVILSHDLGDGHVYHSVYAHLNAITPGIEEGATVATGQQLGELGQSCQGALSCGSFSTPHLHWVIHRDSAVGGSGTGGSYGGNAVVPEPLDGFEDLEQGMTLTSSNSGTVECGDGYCNGGETNADCPEDCPVCEPIGPLGGEVDETSLCFERQGSPQYWYEDTSGWDGSVTWTNATDSADPDNVGVWSLTFEDAGSYALEVYVEPGFGTSELAAYQVTHAGGSTEFPVDQSAVDGWHLLDELSFDASQTYTVTLNDNTGEAFSLSRVLAFDALRLTRTDPPVGEGGGGAGAGGGEPTGGAGAGGGPAGGTGGGPSGDGNAADGAQEDGCGCRVTGATGGTSWSWLGLLAAGAITAQRRSLFRRAR
ncbi:MAG: peptidoglycan DD-metalloendopeptidase family protein [Polyangiaceae bacterium]|nr:peptidoglycan DD-metalloendopeptidase family protein [Polyangiaceae bacterium]MBK8942472.1 peptidoglycan DD-metalloendopeptidase family protein [Polyangiaceae bacterium]